MTEPTAPPSETSRLHNEILEGRAQISELRDLLRSENQRANAAIDREETAEQAALEAQQERDRLRAVVARLAQMADHWEQKLPEVIRTPAVVSAIRAALEPAVSVVPPATNQALRDRIAEALVSWTYRGKEPDPGIGMLETVRANAYGRADAVLAVLPAPVDRTAELAALVRDFLDPDRCQLDHHGYCQAHSWMCGGSRCPHARAREVLAEIDSEQPAVGSCVAAEAPHTATPDEAPWLTDSARIGRALIWSWSDVGKGAFREGYRAAQAEARALLGGERGAETATGARIVAHVLATHTDLHCLNCAPPPLGDIWTPVTADELDDGGVCARCGADVLIPQAPQ